MKRFIALLCFVVLFIGSALSEDVALAPDEIVEVQEEPSEEILVEEPSEEPEIEQNIMQEPDPDPPQEVQEEEPEPEPPIEEPEPEVQQVEESVVEESPVEKPAVELVEEPVQEPTIPVPANEEPQEEILVVETSTETEPAVETSTEPVVETKPKEEVLIAADPEPEVEETTELKVIATSSTMVPEEEVEIEDDDWGHVDDAILPREVHITFLKEPQYFGDESILAATLVNFRFEDSYTIYWQYCEDPTADEIEWKDIEGEHSQVYSFILDKTNYTYGYRVLVRV